MKLLAQIALRHLLDRKRQSLVSLMGIILGVAFFLAISSLMQGSEKDFIRRLIDNSPHITISDEFRTPRLQPLFISYPEGAIELRNVKPMSEPRGIRGFAQIMTELPLLFPGLAISPVLSTQALVASGGNTYGVTLNGMNPLDIKTTTTLETYMVEGSIEDLIANADGIIIGSELARKRAFSLGQNVTLALGNGGQSRHFKLVGLFRTGRATYDEGQAFVALKRVQALLNRPNRANSLILKLQDPYQARWISQQIEARIGYKSVSWQEASEDIMSTLAIRNIIMYTVVSAVLIVAAFGIYNVISTVVMEKQRDISILKAMGFYASDIKQIFIIQGVILGCLGSSIGLPLGMILMRGLMEIRFKPPGATELIQMPLDWGLLQFIIATAFALLAATLAALLPARKAALVHPVEILRGSQ